MSNVSSVFIFEENDVKRKINHDLKLTKRIGESFDYVHAKLKKLKFHVSGKSPKVTKKKSMEGKNYNWVAITSDDVKMLIRTYNTHFTVYACFEETYDYKSTKTGENTTWTEKHYGAFEYSVKTNKITKEDVKEGVPGIPKPKKDDDDYISDYYMDHMYDNPFVIFNTHLKGLIEVIRKGDMHSLWNNYSFKRPHYVSINNTYHGTESISSFDRLIFCADELSCKHMELFAENEMLQEIKKFKVGDEFNGDMHSGTITEVRTELKDGYYHGVGLQIGDDWEDVYSLTRWDLDGVFKPVECKEKRERRVKRSELIKNAFAKLTNEEQSAIRLIFLCKSI